MANNQIYIIEDKHNSLSKNLKIEGIEYTPDLITDSKIDDWVRNTLFRLNNDIEKIIIPIRLGFEDTEYIGLRIGLHIRLTKSLNEKRFVPIIFIGTETDCEIINNQLRNKQLLTSLILFTPGTKLVDLFDLNLNSFPDKLNEIIFKTEVLPKLIITNERGSGHQLSNEWGAFRLAKSAQIELKTLEIPTDLYFKFKFANTDFIIDTKSVNKMADRSKNFNFLIIDDNADKGWTELINHIIGSEIINKFTNKIKSTEILDFEGASNYCDFEAHDVIFLDLRLKKEEEESIQNDSINELSGVQILKKIKEINRGIQVIIITASNKAWNMKKLLDEGADAYFIKESVDISITEEISKQNYNNLVENIKSLFDRIYLRDLFTKIKEINVKLESSKRIHDLAQNTFLDEIKILLEQSFDMHYHAKTDKPFAYAYITLYMVIERINKEFVIQKKDGDWYVDDKSLKFWVYKKEYKQYYEDSEHEPRIAEWKKTFAIWNQKMNNQDFRPIKNLYGLINMRNHFIHNDKDLNTDIYYKKGFMNLFEMVTLIINGL